MKIFRDYDSDGLNKQYVPSNWPRVSAPDIIKRWSEMGSAYRDRANVVRDVRYGESARQCLDLFRSQQSDAAPVLIFIHGGYWRGKQLTKVANCFCAEPLVNAGMLVAMVEYDLCPEVSMDTIVDQLRRATAWLWHNASTYGGDPSRLHVSGHSAGGHLAAMMAATDWPSYGANLPVDLVRSIIPISGLFELEPLRLSAINDDLRMDAAVAQRNSPRHLRPAHKMPITVVVGSEESDEFLRQSAEFAEAWRPYASEMTYFETSGHHHFEVIEAMTEAGNPLTKAILRHAGVG